MDKTSGTNTTNIDKMYMNQIKEQIVAINTVWPESPVQSLKCTHCDPMWTNTTCLLKLAKLNPYSC